MTKIQSNKSGSARELAYKIVFEFERNRSRIDILESKYLEDIHFSAQDRRLTKQLYSGTIRNLLYLDWIIGKLYHGRFTKLLDKIKTVLRLAMYEIIYLDHIPEHATVNEYVSLARRKTNTKQGALVNAILRNYLKLNAQPNPEDEITGKAEILSIKYSYPIWLINRWIELWGNQRTERLCAAFNSEPDFDIHINPGKITPVQMEDSLQEQDIEFRKSELFEGVYKVKNVQNLIHLGWLSEGLCSIQDESAHIPVEVLDIQDNDYVLDMCAAPGGKFIQILQKKRISSTTIAIDIDKSRLRRVKDNMQRLNLTNGFLIVADGRQLPFKPVFDKILLDAPCSGLGVISKHPDIKWRRSEAEIKSFANLQTELLEQASSHLKTGGKLVYSTCTIDPRENEQITVNFVNKHGDQFEQIKPTKTFKSFLQNKHLQTFPDDNKMDGSYCAIFKKI